MGDAIVYTANFFSWVYQMLTGFVIIPNVLNLFDVFFYMMIVTVVMRFFFGGKS